MMGVLVFDTLPGLFIGISLSLVTLLYRSSRPHVPALVRKDVAGGMWVDAARHSGQPVEPDVVVLRVEGGLYFANADYVRDRVRSQAADQTRVVILDGETMPFVYVSGASMLIQLVGDLARTDVRLILAQDVGQVRDVFSATEGGHGTLRVYPTVDDAMAAAREQIDDA